MITNDSAIIFLLNEIFIVSLTLQVRCKLTLATCCDSFPALPDLLVAFYDEQIASMHMAIYSQCVSGPLYEKYINSIQTGF